VSLLAVEEESNDEFLLPRSDSLGHDFVLRIHAMFVVSDTGSTRDERKRGLKTLETTFERREKEDFQFFVSADREWKHTSSITLKHCTTLTLNHHKHT
jgi:hypothetical protein